MFDRFHEKYTLREEKNPFRLPCGLPPSRAVEPARETITLSFALPVQGRVPNEKRREGCKVKRRTDATTPPSCLRQATSPYTGEAIMGRPWQATVSAAQGKRRLSHGFCPQWQKPQFAAHARHTVAMRIMLGSPPYTGEAIMWTTPFVMLCSDEPQLDKVLRSLWSERNYQLKTSPPRRCM